MAGADLVASKVDGLNRSGLVDADFCLPQRDQKLFGDPSLLFRDGLDGIPKVSCYTSGSRHEYAALVVSQLKSQKVALTRFPMCSADTFVVSKRGTNRLREVWNGSLISAASCEPTTPRWLADPAALVVLEASCDAPVY